MLILQKQKSKSYFNYCIQGNICSPPPIPRFIFALIDSGRIQDWANSYVSNFILIFTTLSGRIKDGEKPLASRVKHYQAGFIPAVI